MDRRKRKTRQAIFRAFDSLIVRQDYAKISVQQIIDEADIGRSTFYEHFETKDELLRAKCTDLFEHIFSPLGQEKTHSFPNNSTFGQKILHILHHLLDDRKVIKGILSGESCNLFMGYFRTYFYDMAIELPLNDRGIPREYLLNHIAGSFTDTVRWWTDRDFCEPPEKLAEYYLKTVDMFIGGRDDQRRKLADIRA